MQAMTIRYNRAINSKLDRKRGEGTVKGEIFIQPSTFYTDDS